jgi:hypothetical protein
MRVEVSEKVWVGGAIFCAESALSHPEAAKHVRR